MISDLDERVVPHYSWNEMSYVKCPRISQNMQPAFYKFSSKVSLLIDQIALLYQESALFKHLAVVMSSKIRGLGLWGLMILSTLFQLYRSKIGDHS